MEPDALVAAIVPFKRALYAAVLAAFAADLGAVGPRPSSRGLSPAIR